MIVISHEPDFVAKYADRVLYINCSLVSEGKPEDVFTHMKLHHQ